MNSSKFIEFRSIKPLKDAIVNENYIVSVDADYIPYGMGKCNYFIITTKGNYEICYDEYIKIKKLLNGG